MKTKFKNIIIGTIFFISAFIAAEESSKKVYVIPIQDVIDLGIPGLVNRGIDLAESNNADLILFDIDTFGGRVDAATQIKDAIASTEIETIAFINRRAISAGSLISLSCDQIFMTEGATIGATSVVDMSGSKQSEKSQSYMREEMAATAEKSGKNPEIARGMVDEELSFEFLIVEGDTLTVTDIEGRKEGKLITLTTELALKYGIADGKSESVEELLKSLNIEDYQITVVDENWSENVVRIFTNPTVSSLLTTFGTIGVISELYSAGWGIGGTIGIICLTLALGAGYLTQLASATDLLIVFFGLAMLFVEFVAIPGFGLFGITGIVVLFYGLYLLLIPDIPVGPEVYSEAMDGFSWAIVVGIFGIIFLLRLIEKLPFFKVPTRVFVSKTKFLDFFMTFTFSEKLKFS